MPDPGSALTSDPTGGPSTLLTRVDALLAEVAAMQRQVFTAARTAGSLPSVLAGLFAGPPAVMPSIAPYAEIKPGIRVGLADGAMLDLRVVPKAVPVPSAYPCALELAFTGPSAWLSIEVEIDWSSLNTGRRFHLTICGTANRNLEIGAVLRLSRPDGSYFDQPLVNVKFEAAASFAQSDGDTDLGVRDDIDMSQRPMLLLYFDTTAELGFRIDQLTAFFS